MNALAIEELLRHGAKGASCLPRLAPSLDKPSAAVMFT